MHKHVSRVTLKDRGLNSLPLRSNTKEMPQQQAEQITHHLILIVR